MIETTTNTLTATQVDCIERFAARLSGRYGASLMVFDKDCNCITNVSAQACQTAPDLLAGLAGQTFDGQPEQVVRFADNEQIISIGLKDADRPSRPP